MKISKSAPEVELMAVILRIYEYSLLRHSNEQNSLVRLRVREGDLRSCRIAVFRLSGDGCPDSAAKDL
jgi:hypothetical protein